jgi:hypothetical protein
VPDPNDKTIMVSPADAAPVSLPFEDQRGTSDTVGYADCLALNRIGTAPPALGTILCRYGGSLRLVVIAKAAFSMTSTPMDPADAPRIYLRDAFYRDRPMGRVVASSDVVPGRTRVDVTLDGHAQAPGGEAVTEMTVRLTLRQQGSAAIDKSLLIVGDEGDDGPKPFVKMPVGYERAPQGQGPGATPIGVMDGEHANIRDPSDPMRAAGFGALAAIWPARRRLLTAPQRKLLKQPVMELAADFDWRYFQAAPPDQQLDNLAPDATIVISGFDADQSSLEAQLPEAEARGVIFGLDATNEKRPGELSFRADSLHIDADRAQCVVTWRAIVELASEALAPSLLVVAGVQTSGGPIKLPKSPPRVPRRRNKPLVVPEKHAPKKGETLGLPPSSRVPGKQTLPFQPAVRVPEPAQPEEHPLTRTAYVAAPSKAADLPFQRPSASATRAKPAAADLGPSSAKGMTLGVLEASAPPKPPAVSASKQPPAPKAEAAAPLPKPKPTVAVDAPEKKAEPERPPERVISVPESPKPKPKKAKKKKPQRRVSEGQDLNAILYGKK